MISARGQFLKVFWWCKSQRLDRYGFIMRQIGVHCVDVVVVVVFNNKGSFKNLLSLNVHLVIVHKLKIFVSQAMPKTDTK